MEDTPPKPVATTDVEAPKSDETEKDPSVVLTADESSVGEASNGGSGSKRRSIRAYCLAGFILAVFVAGISLAVVFWKRSSTNDKNGKANSSMEFFDDEGRPCDANGKPLVDMNPGAEEPSAVFLLPSELPFPEVPPVRAFTQDVLQGYDSVEHFKADLSVAVQHMMNRIILRLVQNNFYYGQNAWQSEPGQGRPAQEEQEQEVAQEAAASASIAQAGTTSNSKNPSKTNNQERDADEADHIKNDENYVYASFGDYLLVWDHKTGNQTFQIQMPSHYSEEVLQGYSGWVPPTYIHEILLTPNHVVVMVDPLAKEEHEDGIFYDNQGTHVRIYTKPTPTKPEMELVTTYDLNGLYRDGRYLEDTQSIHLVTYGEMSIYQHLVAPLLKLSTRDLSIDEHLQQVTELASTKLIPEFVDAVSQALMVNGILPNMLQINSWNNKELQKKSVEETVQEHQDLHHADLPIRSVYQVTTLKVEEETGEDAVTTSAFFSPAKDIMFYGTADNLVLSVLHSYYNDTGTRTRRQEDLFLVHLKASNNSSFHSLAPLSGHINSPYSLDIEGNDLRVATTLQKWSPLERVFPLCGDSDIVFDTPDKCITEANWEDCFDLAINGCQELIRTGCPYEYSCGDENLLTPEEASSTDNFVIVFDISTPGDMVERGRVRIGDPHEVITSVRFWETFAYAMTFDQRDPFYVLKLEPGQPPKVTGSLKLDGFSRYLHPLNADATLLVGIGQNTTGTGINQVNSGVMITVFDVNDPANPVAVQSHMLEQDDTVDSSSTAEYDAKAVQYANGKLVLPVTIYGPSWGEVGDDQAWFDGDANMDDFVEAEVPETALPEESEDQNFEGFIVFTVGYTGIEESFRINHNRDGQFCYYCNGGIMDARSILFDDGSLMTMHSQSVMSTNVYTGQLQWEMNVTLDGVSMDCCW